jgi:hypothetical protein
MAENRRRPDGYETKVDLSEGRQNKGGAQVVQTNGLPDGYEPPSASLMPPPSPAPRDSGSGSAPGPSDG